MKKKKGETAVGKKAKGKSAAKAAVRRVDMRANPLYPDRIENNAMGVLLAVISVIVAIILLVVIVMNFSYTVHPERAPGYVSTNYPVADTTDAYEEDAVTEEVDAAEETEEAITEEVDTVQEETEDLTEEGVESGAIVEEETEIAEEATDYIIADSDSRYLTTADLEGLSAEELRIARNEIYARHGRKFTDEALQEYFDSKEWYTGTIEPSDFTESMLNDYERENAYTISDYEEAMGY